MQLQSCLPITLALFLTAGGALAAPPAGQLLASQCAQCHGTNGNGPGFDKLSGMSARELSSEMREMKSRKTPEGIMGRQAHGYTDAQIQLIAAYLSGQRSGGTTGTTSTTGTTGTTGSSTSKDTSDRESKPVTTEQRRRGLGRDHRD